MVKYIKNLKVINSYIPIIDVEFNDFSSDMLNETFDENNFHRHDYGNLVVQQGRLSLPTDSVPKSYKDFYKDLQPDLRYISLELFKLDKTRYPIHGIERDIWFDKKFPFPYFHHCVPTIDKKGFYMSWHLDNRLIVVSGSINIQDNCVSTIFQTNNTNWKDKNYVGNTADLVYIGQTKKYTGTFWLNTELTWHAVPEIIHDRKTLLFNIFF
jgi:hypothetical protein